MGFFAVRLLRLTTVGIGTPQGLLCVRPLHRVNINVIFPIRRDRAIIGFLKLMTIRKQCLLKLAEKIKDGLLSEVSLDKAIMDTVVCKPCSVQDAPLDDLLKEIIVSNKGIPIEAGDQSCLC
jgi:hypothetical protein